MMRYGPSDREEVSEGLPMFQEDALQTSCDDPLLREPEEAQLLLWCSEENQDQKDAHGKATLEGVSCMIDCRLPLFSEKQQEEPLTLPPPPTRGRKLSKLRRSVTDETAARPSVTNETVGESSSFLHRTCQLFSQSKDVVESVLVMEPESARKSIRILSSQQSTSSGRQRIVMERHSYPINIALGHNADPKVIEVLANAAPEVLVLHDGRESMASLSIALRARQKRQSSATAALVVQALLDASPSCASVVDRHQNLPLHVACSKGASLEVVQKVYRAYPEALKMANFWCNTPLDVAQSNDACPEEVVDFLQQQEVGHIKVDLL